MKAAHFNNNTMEKSFMTKTTLTDNGQLVSVYLNAVSKEFDAISSTSKLFSNLISNKNLQIL